MIPTSRLLEFCATALAIILIPGPSVLFTLARGVAWGRAVAVATAVGNGVGMWVLAVFVAFGLGPILTHSRPASITLQIAGGIYLLWLGKDALQHRREHAAAMTKREPTRPKALTIIRQGFTVGALNPKVLIFFVAVLPHFVTRSKGHVTVQLLVLGSVFAAMSILMDGTWGFIAGTAREWLASNPSRLVTLRTVGGVVMVGLGVLIIVSAALS